MSKAYIKLEQELKDNIVYYKVMLKRKGWFTSWYKEFGSFDKKKTNSIYYKILKAKNIETI